MAVTIVAFVIQRPGVEKWTTAACDVLKIYVWRMDGIDLTKAVGAREVAWILLLVAWWLP